MKNKISVIGAGNGGVTAAYHITKNGSDVLLYDTVKFDKIVNKIKAKKNTITALSNYEGYDMLFGGKETIVEATTDPKQAAEFSKYLLFICPSFAQEALFSELLPYLKDGQVIILMPGNYGALALQKFLKDNNNDIKLTFVDAISIPWATRLVEDGSLAIYGIKEMIPLSVWPKTEAAETISVLKEILPIEPIEYANPIVAGLENINYGGHPLMTICSIGLLENFNGEFNYYKDCNSPATAEACKVMDKERLSIGKAYGWKLLPELEAMNMLYNADEKSVYDFNAKSTTHGKITSAPNSSKSRYITEDVPFVLVPAYFLAKKAGIEMPIVESLIRIAGAFNNENYFETGRNLKSLGIDDYSVEEIVEYMKN